MTGNHQLLYRLAELMFEHEQHILPVDLLFDDEQIGDFVKSIQIDSPYQQMLLDGVLTESVRDEILYVIFTIEGYFHFVLGEVIYNRTDGLDAEALKQIVEESKLNGVKEGVEQCLIRDVQKDDLIRLMYLIDLAEENSEKYITPLICSLRYLGVDITLKELFHKQSDFDWNLLMQLIVKLESLNCYNLADDVSDKSLEFNKANSEASMLFKLKYIKSFPADVETILDSLIDVMQKKEDDFCLANLIGDTYKKWGQYDIAINFYKKTIEYILNQKDLQENQVAFLEKKVGDTYFLKKDYKLAFEYYNKSKQYYLKYENLNPLEFAALYKSLGKLFLEINDIDLSLLNFEKSLSIFSKMLGKTTPVVQDIYAYIGDCLQKKDNLESAIIFYEQANNIAINILHQRFELTDFSLSSISDCYLKLGQKEERKKNNSKAIDYYKMGIQHIASFENKSEYDSRDLYFKIAKFLKKQKEYNSSIEYFMQCVSIDDEDMEACFGIAQLYDIIDNKLLAFVYYLKTIIIFESVCFDDIENYISGAIAFDDETKINPFEKAIELAKDLGKIDELPDWLLA
jgi:tetratricopeptide (TPR) repeat protein